MILNIFDSIIANNGHINSLAGIIVVFFGLVMISIAISLFNKASHFFKNREEGKVAVTETTEEVKVTDVKDIPEDELVAIATAVEVYRKLHFEVLQNEITFTHGSAQTPWKTLQRNRKTVTRVR